MTREEIEQGIRERGEWFHNMELGGVWTAPRHFLGNYPYVKWKNIQKGIPADLTGLSVLDIGCNGGFYSIEMKRRGAARVLGIDTLDYYLEQARFAARVTGCDDIEFRNLSVYDLGTLGESFDVVIFMGVLYHLRHPLLALDIIRDTVAGDWMLFQSMLRGDMSEHRPEPDYRIAQEEVFTGEQFPRAYFVERRYSGDETNWWIPNRPAVEGMLRSAGFAIVSRPEQEVYVCRRADLPWAPDAPFAVYAPAPANHQARFGEGKDAAR